MIGLYPNPVTFGFRILYVSVVVALSLSKSISIAYHGLSDVPSSPLKPCGPKSPFCPF
jgi:hypothetical protein